LAAFSSVFETKNLQHGRHDPAINLGRFHSKLIKSGKKCLYKVKFQDETIFTDIFQVGNLVTVEEEF
jgi:hypothetical protein